MLYFLYVYDRENRTKSTARIADTASDRQPRVKRIDVHYEYFDGGNHFCRYCNCFSVNIFEHCQHLISSSHQQVDRMCLFSYGVEIFKRLLNRQF